MIGSLPKPCSTPVIFQFQTKYCVDYDNNTSIYVCITPVMNGFLTKG